MSCWCHFLSCHLAHGFFVLRIAKSFNFGDVIEVAGLAVAVPDGVVVEVKQPQGGWVYQRLRDQTILEEVQALKVSKLEVVISPSPID